MSDNLYTPPSAPVSDHSDASERDVEIRESHVSHEASLRTFGMLYYLGGVFLVIGAVGLLAAGLAGGEETGMDSSLFIGIALGYVVLAVLMIWVGRGLRTLNPKGRTPAIILAAIGLLGFPLGTILNGYQLYLLLSAKGKMIFTAEYTGIRARTPQVKVPTPLLVWIVLGIILLGIGAAVLLPMFAGGPASSFG